MPRDTLAILWSAAKPVKRGFLYALIGSVGIGAFMAIFAIVFDFYWWGDKAFFSALTIVAASGCGTACGAYLKSARERALPLLGVALAPFAAAALLLTIWVEPGSDEILWKTTVTLCVFAVAVAHLCLLFTARLAARFQWALAVAYVVSFFLTAHLTLIIWFDAGLSIFHVWVVILYGAITSVILIFHRLSRGDRALPRGRQCQLDRQHGRAAGHVSVAMVGLSVDSIEEGPHVHRNTLGALRSPVEPVKRGLLIWLAGALATAAAVATLLSLLAEALLWRDPVLGKTAVVLWVFAVAAAHLSLLSKARLATGFQWSLVVAYVVIPFLSALLTIIIWFEIVNLLMFEVLAVTAVLYAAITVVIPIFQRLSRKQGDGVDVDTRVEGRRAP